MRLMRSVSISSVTLSCTLLGAQVAPPLAGDQIVERASQTYKSPSSTRNRG